MSTTNKRLLQADIRALLLRSVELWVGIQNIMGYVWIADRKTLVSIWSHDRNWSQTIAEDRKRSQKIEHGSIFSDRLRTSAITIAEVCFHMIADDRRTFCDLRSAIRDRLRSYENQSNKKQNKCQTSVNYYHSLKTYSRDWMFFPWCCPLHIKLTVRYTNLDLFFFGDP